MKALVFATKMEAEPAVKSFGFERVGCAEFEIYKNKSAVLAVSGIGILAAALCAQFLIKNFEIEKILNAGACGALSKKGGLGDVFEIGKVLCADPYCEEEFLIGRENNTLVSSSKPIVSAEGRARFSKVADFADMECYGILKSLAFSKFSLENFAAVKVVSDFSAGCDIKKNIPKIMPNLNQKIGEWLGA